MNMSDHEFWLLKDYLFKQSGIDVAEEKRYLFTTRLSDLAVQEKCASFTDFHKLLTSGKPKHLAPQVIELMTTHESSFFRDEHPYKVLSEIALPEAAARRKAQAHFLPPRLRILSAGCSFGQEPYSIALCVQRWLPTQSVFSLQDISIVGIDISAITLERAKKAIFTEMELGKQLSIPEREQYFTKCADHWRVCDALRTMVSYQQANLSEPIDSLGKFDIIFCRNVIIYFSIDGRKAVLGRLGRALEPGGVLFLGSAESMYNLSANFTSHVQGLTTYYTVLKGT